MNTHPTESKPKVSDQPRKTVRTSISLSARAKEQGDELVEMEGFASFSDFVEYLIRRRSEKLAAA